MGIIVSCNNLMPQRRDCQCTPVILVGGGGTIIAGGIGNSGGGIYCGSSSICVSGDTISANFGTTSTTVACGSHEHPLYAPLLTPLFITCACAPIFCGTSCVKAPVTCGTTCVRGGVIFGNTCVTGAVSCGTTCIVTPTLKATTGIISPVIQLTTGAGAGRVLTSDADGNASWCIPFVGTTCLCGLTGDVTITTPQLNNVLVYNSSKWVNTNNINLDCIAAGTRVISPIISGITCVSSPIICGTTCVRTPILCASTAVRAVNVCATTGILTPKIQITTGAGDGCVLTSDEFGNATWTTPEAGVTYTAGNGISIAGTVISADFGTTATKVSCGSHVHGNISNVGAIGTASGCIVCTTTSGILTTVSPSLVSVGTANNATCLNGQLPAYYATTGHTHGIYALVNHCLAHVTGSDKIPVFTCTCRGLVPPPQSCDGQSLLANDGTWKTVNSLSGITDTQYLQFNGYGSGTLTNGTAYYWGAANRLSTSGALNRVYIPQNGTLAKLYAYGNFGTMGNACAICLWVVKNNSTCCLIQVQSVSSVSRCWQNSNVALSVSAGDYLEMKVISCASAGAVYFNATAQLTAQITPYMNLSPTERYYNCDGTPIDGCGFSLTTNVPWCVYESATWVTLAGVCCGTGGVGTLTCAVVSANPTNDPRSTTLCFVSTCGITRYAYVYQCGCTCECCELEI